MTDEFLEFCRGAKLCVANTFQENLLGVREIASFHTSTGFLTPCDYLIHDAGVSPVPQSMWAMMDFNMDNKSHEIRHCDKNSVEDNVPQP